ncbi:transposase [Lentibacillus sp. CBA3610]|uniref:IS1634 family transposase n=1 Tax=Lentibacillus sp. CBA3610 TaxID=2518176 RepID=UPI0020D21F06|nr:transposase [Lentibacillus sp. CBA3610]
MSLTFVRKELDAIYDGFRSFEHYSEKYELYARTVRTTWHYTQQRPYKGDALTQSRRMYIHFYYNIDRAAEDEKAFDRKLINLRRELESGKRLPEHEKQYQTYFETKTTPKRGTKVTVKEEAVNKAKRYFGYFALMTNETMGAIAALELYRNKDVVEKAFGNLKERLNMRRTLVSSDRVLMGNFVCVCGAHLSFLYQKTNARYRFIKKIYVTERAGSTGCYRIL